MGGGESLRQQFRQKEVSNEQPGIVRKSITGRTPTPCQEEVPDRRKKEKRVVYPEIPKPSRQNPSISRPRREEK